MRDEVPALDVVICTYDNEGQLARVLDALGAQVDADGRWSLLVVDNNSGPGTQALLARHQEAGRSPALRVVREPVQGLTHARRRAVLETTAPWVAFVDDDCVLDPDWVAAALAFAADHPGAAGFGGRVVLAHEVPPPPFVARIGWAFAEQDHGDEPREVGSLAGAGMVLNREALEACGWVDEPLLPDRVGRRLVSGGDVEISLRLAATGRPLWYVPACRLHHEIPTRRTRWPYLLRLVTGLGASSSLASALTTSSTPARWAAGRARNLAEATVRALRAIAVALVRRRGTQDGRLGLAFAVGGWLGLARVSSQLVRGDRRIFGRAILG